MPTISKIWVVWLSSMLPSNIYGSFIRAPGTGIILTFWVGKYVLLVERIFFLSTHDQAKQGKSIKDLRFPWNRNNGFNKRESLFWQHVIPKLFILLRYVSLNGAFGSFTIFDVTFLICYLRGRLMLSVFKSLRFIWSARWVL